MAKALSVRGFFLYQHSSECEGTHRPGTTTSQPTQEELLPQEKQIN